MRKSAFLLPLALAFASPALAQEAAKPAAPDSAEVGAADKARAMKKFDDGSRAFSQRRYKDAIDLFLQADAIVPNAAFAYNAGLAYEAMGDVPAALRWSREYLRRDPRAKDRAEVEDRIGRYETHLRERGLQQVTVRSTPPGATVTIDKTSVGVTPWTGELTPGAHTLVLVLRGYDDLERPIDLDNKRSLDIDSVLQASVESKSATPPPPPTAPETKARSPWMLVSSITLLGLGAAGGAAAVGLEVKRASLVDDVRAAPLQVEASDTYDTMLDYQLAARVVTGVAAGLGLAGGVLLIVDRATAPSDSPSATAFSSVHVSGGCDDTGCRAGFAYDF